MKKISAPDLDFKKIAASFQNLNAKDVGTWPTPPKVLALLGIFALFILAGWAGFLSDQINTLGERRADEERLKQEFVAKKTQAVNLPLHRQQLAEIDKTFGSLLKQLPSKSEVEALLIEVNQSGMGRGLQFELFKPNTELVRDFYAELPVNVRLIGTYHDFGAFADDIARLSRIVTLNNLSIESSKSGMLTLNAIIKTFRYLDEEELAAKRKADQEAKKGRRK